MKRITFLWRLLDARDRLMVAGALGAVILVAGGVGFVHGRLEARAGREARCTERVRQDEARWRAKGLTVVRLSMPCESEGRR